MTVDTLLITVSFFLALLIRFDGRFGDIPAVYVDRSSTVTFFLILIVSKITVFYFFKLYRSLWRYAGIQEGVQIVLAVVFANMLFLTTLIFFQMHFPRSVYLMTPIFDLFFIVGIRFNYRMMIHLKKTAFTKKLTGRKNVMIIGGGVAGAMVIRELHQHGDLRMHPVAIIDDDSAKHGQLINGVRIVGNRSTIQETVTKLEIDVIIIAVPSAPALEVRHIIEECNKTNCAVKILPGLYEIITGAVTIDQIRDVEIEDLLGRDPVTLDTNEINAFLHNKKVMITGGGGSIGSELCRQIARYQPASLFILDIYENNAFDIQQELIRAYPSLDLHVIIASVRDAVRMTMIMETLRPHVVFHAAAHKHVPLMEENPTEAVKNNVFGTINTIEAAIAVNVEKFVLISTDKAVNPTNVMGATKRLCEMAVQAYNGRSSTEFVAVRFGNVLGSNGSVIPLFKKQIASGGPITVTHADITRFFMTIPEAAQLVLQAGAMAKGGEVFILDMGEPVKIVDLARNLIKLSGLEPDVDIAIKITGLRPGEKLYEELLLAEEGIESTRIKKIFIGNQTKPDYDVFKKNIDVLWDVVESHPDPGSIKKALAIIVPTYKQS